MRRVYSYIIKAVAALVSLFVIFMVVAYITEYRPANREELTIIMPVAPQAGQESLPDTITILNWNIGYCGLGSEMDFFFDGGSRTRTTFEQTARNLEMIIEKIKAIDADIVMLQEVDVDSKRSYNIDQIEVVRQSMPSYYALFSHNYKSLFVPIPLRDPMGRVESGLMILSKYKIFDAQRVQYPVADSFPVRAFNLKRGIALCKMLYCGDTIVVANTHNSAYDNGEARQNENRALESLLQSQQYSRYSSIIGGDWNQIPPNYTLSEAASNDINYRPISVDPLFMASTHDWVADTSKPSMRYLDTPFDAASKVAITDFFLASKDFEVLSVETLDLGFESSDHNPVVVVLSLIK